MYLGHANLELVYLGLVLGYLYLGHRDLVHLNTRRDLSHLDLGLRRSQVVRTDLGLACLGLVHFG